jgi:hypothetical protein
VRTFKKCLPEPEAFRHLLSPLEEVEHRARSDILNYQIHGSVLHVDLLNSEYRVKLAASGLLG